MNGHYPALDGLRGVAIVLVLLHHFTIIEPVTSLDRWLQQVFLIGWSGVDLFFVLSGFLITGILIDARDSPRYFTSFYARRTLRIFPLYYIVVFATLVVLPAFPRWFELLAGAGAPREQWPYWLYLTNFAVASRDAFLHGVLDITWSLAIEEQFYLVWAVVVWLCPPRTLKWLCAAIVVLVPVLRAWSLADGASVISVYVLPWFRADALAAGAFVACLMRAARPNLSMVAPAIGAASAIGLAVVAWLDGGPWWWEPRMQRFGFTFIAITASAMLVSAIAHEPSRIWPRLLSAPWLRACGRFSYCLYLIHLPVMRVVREYVMPPDTFHALGAAWIGQLVFYALATAPALAIAWISWHLVETPILRLKSYFPYR